MQTSNMIIFNSGLLKLNKTLLWRFWNKKLIIFEGVFYDQTLCFLPGQCWVLQEAVSTEDPVHCFPPYAGLGLLQVRYLFLMPPPHDLLHVP